jgi:hypothetical protein
LQAFGAFFDAEFNPLPFFKGTIPLSHDGRVVYEDIRPVLLGKKPVSLGIIEPLDCSDDPF